jgi:hypothetical protein
MAMLPDALEVVGRSLFHSDMEALIRRTQL